MYTQVYTRMRACTHVRGQLDMTCTRDVVVTHEEGCGQTPHMSGYRRCSGWERSTTTVCPPVALTRALPPVPTSSKRGVPRYEDRPMPVCTSASSHPMTSQSSPADVVPSGSRSMSWFGMSQEFGRQDLRLRLFARFASLPTQYPLLLLAVLQLPTALVYPKNRSPRPACVCSLDPYELCGCTTTAVGPEVSLLVLPRRQRLVQ